MRLARLEIAVLAAAAIGLLPAPASAVSGTGGCRVFPSNNVWNTPIDTLPLNRHSAAWLASANAGSTNLHPDFGASPYGMPYAVVDSTHPLRSISFDYADESDPGPYPVGSDTPIENGSDAHALVINHSTCKLFELYAYDGAGHAGSGAIFDLGSNRLRPAGWTSADAAGLPIFPGLVRPDEVRAGAIRHAIRFTVQRTQKAYLWPARHQAGESTDPNLPPMGARFRLKRSYDLSRFSPGARVILQALKTYGLILADNGSNWYFQGTEDSYWNDTLLDQLKSVPAGQFEAVDESSLMIDPNSAQARQAVVPAPKPPPPSPKSPRPVALVPSPSQEVSPSPVDIPSSSPSPEALPPLKFRKVDRPVWPFLLVLAVILALGAFAGVAWRRSRRGSRSP